MLKRSSRSSKNRLKTSTLRSEPEPDMDSDRQPNSRDVLGVISCTVSFISLAILKWCTAGLFTNRNQLDFGYHVFPILFACFPLWLLAIRIAWVADRNADEAPAANRRSIATLVAWILILLQLVAVVGMFLYGYFNPANMSGLH